ncbi:hypothetical protein [Amycolatopsis sp. lyj-108]|uniref:hypothetical protein n=1 Tax=Amycolatopsis sp. lyj-108 TaxID=2789286 RepID=UPI003978C538
MPHPLIQAETAHLAQAAPAGASTTMLITLGLIVLVLYLVKHKRHRLGTAFLGFVVGCLLGATPMGKNIAGTVVEIVRQLTLSIVSVFS